MTLRHSGSVPPFAELDMPEQNLRRYVRERRLAWPSIFTMLARLLTFGGALALTVYATIEMIAVVSVGIVSVLQWAMVALFAITFGWIALPATAAVSGVLFGWVRRRAKASKLGPSRSSTDPASLRVGGSRRAGVSASRIDAEGHIQRAPADHSGRQRQQSYQAPPPSVALQNEDEAQKDESRHDPNHPIQCSDVRFHDSLLCITRRPRATRPRSAIAS